MEFGKTLKEKREEKEYSLEFVQEETKIRKYYLEALENENFSVLPQRVYATGFVKKYTRFLELNESEMVQEFLNLAYGSDEEEEIIVNQSLGQGPRRFSYKSITIAAIFLLVVIWLGNYFINIISSNYSDLLRPGVQETENKIPDNNPTDISENEKEVIVKASLLVEARSNCWVRIVVDDKEQFSGILAPGEIKSFEGDESIYIKAGNAGGLDLTYNGNKIEPLGPINTVNEKTFLAEEQEIE